MKNVTRIMVVTFILTSIVFLTGCTGGEVTNVKTGLRSGAINKGQPILVKDFDTTHTVFTGDNATDATIVKRQKQQITNDLKFLLIIKLTQKGFKAYDFNERNQTQGAVVIDGKFARVNNGSGAARFIVGMGAGAAWMEGTVKIYKIENPQNILAEFQTETSSKGSASPGNYTEQLIRELANTIADYIGENY